MISNRGFSLVEVLIVLLLTSILMIMLFSALRTGASSLQLADRFVERTEDERQLVNLLHRHMRQLVPWSKSAGDTQESAFLGDADSIRYIAPLSMSAASQPYLIEITAAMTGREGTWVRFVPFEPDQDTFRLLREQEYFQLSEEIKLGFRYYDMSEATHGWVSSWNGRTDLPRLLELRIKGENQRILQLVLSIVAASPHSRDPELRRALEILEGFKQAI